MPGFAENEAALRSIPFIVMQGYYDLNRYHEVVVVENVVAQLRTKVILRRRVTNEQKKISDSRCHRRGSCNFDNKPSHDSSESWSCWP